MFVDIESFKGAIGVENILMPYKKGRLSPDKKTRLPKEPITPDICWQILKSTNNPVNIQHMLECVAELPASEQAHFKEVVLATFSNREQPNKQPHNIVLLGKKLAVASGYEAELADAQKIKGGDFLLSTPKLAKGFISFQTFFSNVDFSAYEKLICLSDEKIEFNENVKFSKNLEISNSSDVSFYDAKREVGSDLQGVQSISFKDGAKVNLSRTTNLPPNLDVSKCAYVNLFECDLKDRPNLRFKDGARVDLYGVQNLPPNLDVSMCSGVDLEECDLKDQPNLRFKDGARVNLYGVQNLPPNLDVSCCDEVGLSHCDLNKQPNLRFKEGAKVNLVRAKNLPPNLDFSQCDEVNLEGCDLNKQPNLRFKDGAVVRLKYAKNLSSQLDFFMCDEVYLNRCDLSDVPLLVFKNRRQMERSGVELPDDWKGKLVFANGIGYQLGKLVVDLFGNGGRS